jgi:hypothetical protein
LASGFPPGALTVTQVRLAGFQRAITSEFKPTPR